MEIFKNVMLVLLGVVIAVAVFCMVVGIGCAANGLTFGQQISEWFGSNAETIEEVAEETVETVSQTLII